MSEMDRKRRREIIGNTFSELSLLEQEHILEQYELFVQHNARVYGVQKFYALCQIAVAELEIVVTAEESTN